VLTKVEARNSAGSLLTFQFDDVSTGLVVKDIQGLDPVKATISKSNYAQRAGTQFNAARREDRNVLIKLGLKPDNSDMTVGDLREQLYDFFMPEVAVDLTFYDGTRVVSASGRVESFEAPLFTREPEANLSVICFDPDFIALDPVTLSGSTVSTTTETLISYPGSAAAGFLLTLNLNRAETDFSIYLRGPDGTTRQMDFTVSMVSGDVLKVNTQTGLKSVKLTHSSVESSALYALEGTTWLTLSKGDNYIRVYATGAAIPFDLTYTPRYGGL
jgi:hypothetical protein